MHNLDFDIIFHSFSSFAMIRLIYLTLKGTSGEVFFEILQRNAKVSLRSGKVDSNGVSNHKSFESVEQANKLVDKLVGEKFTLGYTALEEKLRVEVANSVKRKLVITKDAKPDDDLATVMANLQGFESCGRKKVFA